MRTFGLHWAIVLAAIATAIRPVCKYLSWRAWLKFNRQVMAQANDPAALQHTDEVARSFFGHLAERGLTESSDRPGPPSPGGAGGARGDKT